MEKKKIIFLSPKNKGGTYYYYKNISDHLTKNYSLKYEIYFYNSLFSYIKLHFVKCDVIFSIIPFVFKPIFAKKYIFNLHGNYKIERKNKGLGVKLLYLTEFNLWFADRIMLTSNYLSDKLGFTEKYKDKIIIVPNFVEDTQIKNEGLEVNNYNFLTITSFKFYDKAKGVIHLGEVIRLLGEKLPKEKILFTIIGNEDNETFTRIKAEFDKINFPLNVKIEWRGWLEKNDLEKEFLNHNTFLYWTYLDNIPSVVLHAIGRNLRVLVNDSEDFNYFLDESVICSNEETMFERIVENVQSENILKGDYSLEAVISEIIKII